MGLPDSVRAAKAPSSALGARQLRLGNSGARPAERRQAFTSNGLQYG
jgi:hypothetical protein